MPGFECSVPWVHWQIAVLAVPRRGCTLPCHYLHNRERKLVTSQDVILVMFHLHGEISPAKVYHIVRAPIRVSCSQRSPRISQNNSPPTSPARTYSTRS